jgi:hypothetical protein
VSIYRMVLTGLATMGAVALCSAIWPTVAGVAADVFVSLLVMAVSVLAALGVRRIRSELAWRRELRTMPAVGAGVDTMAPVALAELRDSA